MAKKRRKKQNQLGAIARRPEGRSFEPLEARMLLSGNPVATNDTYTASNNGNTAIPAGYGVLANDTDPNHLPLTAMLTARPYYGSVQLNSDGSFTYSCSNSYAPGDSFSYEAYNGTSYSNVATVMLHCCT